MPGLYTCTDYGIIGGKVELYLIVALMFLVPGVVFALLQVLDYILFGGDDDDK